MYHLYKGELNHFVFNYYILNFCLAACFSCISQADFITEIFSGIVDISRNEIVIPSISKLPAFRSINGQPAVRLNR